MSQVIPVANNQTMIANQNTTTTIYTDPIAMGEYDRLTCHFNVESIFNTTSPGAKYTAQVSMDGLNWYTSSVSDSSITTTATPQVVGPTVVPGVFLRFKLEFTASNVGIGACCFDLHVLMDHE